MAEMVEKATREVRINRVTNQNKEETMCQS